MAAARTVVTALDNTVEVVIKGRDDAGPAFATATAEAKAFQRTMDETTRKEIAGHKAASEAEGAHLKALRLLRMEAEDLASNSKGPGYLSLLFSKLGQSFLSAGTSAGGLASTLGLVVAPLAALAAILAGPLIASLLPIIAGFATLAAVAIPEISKVVKALEAQGPAAKKAWAQLSPPEKEIAEKLRSLRGPFHELQKAVQPQVLKAFATGIDIIKQILPTLTPLAVAAGKALNGFLKHISDWLKSDSGKKFLRWMETDGPHAIETFGRVMWDTAQAIGRTFAFLRNAGNSWFRNVRSGLGSIGHAWNIAAGLIARVGRAIVSSARTDFNAVRNVIRALVNSARADFDAISRAVHTVQSAFSTAWHAIVGIVRSAASAIIGAVNSIKSALGGIAGAVSGALGSLGSLPGKALSLIGLAHGGIVGAAGGGPRGGLTWVGEQGPELVRLPLGSTVYPAGQSRMMAAHGGGGDTYNVHVQVSPGTSPAETGRQIAYYLGEFKKRGGHVYRPAGF